MRQSAELYACIYVPEFPAQAVLRLRPDLKPVPCVVMEGIAPFEHVCSLNTKARLLGLQYGMKRVDVDGFPGTTIIPRSLQTESCAREILLECAGTYSPRIEDASADTSLLCAIDITGTESLFGTPDKLARRLLQHVRSLGLSARIVISSNFHAAECFAKGPARQPISILPPGQEAAALSALPLDVLPLTEQHRELFRLWGITTLGMLADLPRNQLVARIGQAGHALQQLARGERPHLFQPIAPPARLHERQELDFPVESLDSLMFVIAVMLDQLILRAVARLVSLAEVTLTLQLDGSATHTRRVRPAQPGNDKKFWIRLLHLDLQANPPQAGVVAVSIEADPGNTSKIQLGLFSPPVPEPTRLDVTLAQIKCFLGEENVGRPVLQDCHAPESFTIEPFSASFNTSTSAVVPKQRTSLRRLRPSEIISVQLTHSRPAYLYFRGQSFTVAHAYGPWISGGEWWNESLWNTEEWDLIAKSANGRSIYCCITHDLLREQWEVTALYD